EVFTVTSRRCPAYRTHGAERSSRSPRRDRSVPTGSAARRPHRSCRALRRLSFHGTSPATEGARTPRARLSLPIPYRQSVFVVTRPSPGGRSTVREREVPFERE